MSAAKYIDKEELRELGRVQTWRGLASIAWTWGWIAGSIALYCWRPSVLTFAIGWVIISGRHLALAVLMHEGAHRLLVKNAKWNDAIGRWLTGHPIMVSMDVYRQIHVQHHRNTWTDADPDRNLATPFPITKKSMWRKVVRDLTGQTGISRYLLIAKVSAGLNPKTKGLGGVRLRSALVNFVKNQRGFLITNGLILAAVTAAGRPEAFLLLWWLPAITGYSFVMRLRSIAEHAVVTDPADELRQTRTTLAPFWLRFLIAPHHVNYHLEHHLYMYVPHYNLPKVHRRLKAAGVLDRAEVASGYWEVLKLATSRTKEDGGPKQQRTLMPFGA